MRRELALKLALVLVGLLLVAGVYPLIVGFFHPTLFGGFSDGPFPPLSTWLVSLHARRLPGLQCPSSEGR